MGSLGMPFGSQWELRLRVSQPQVWSLCPLGMRLGRIMAWNRDIFSSRSFDFDDDITIVTGGSVPTYGCYHHGHAYEYTQLHPQSMREEHGDLQAWNCPIFGVCDLAPWFLRRTPSYLSLSMTLWLERSSHDLGANLPPFPSSAFSSRESQKSAVGWGPNYAKRKQHKRSCKAWRRWGTGKKCLVLRTQIRSMGKYEILWDSMGKYGIVGSILWKSVFFFFPNWILSHSSRKESFTRVKSPWLIQQAEWVTPTYSSGGCTHLVTRVKHQVAIDSTIPAIHIDLATS